MTFRQFAFNNVMRNGRTYAAYFLSSAFSVMVFFVYAVFAFHPALTEEAMGGRVSSGMHFAESVIYVFSFFFVMYSMSAFLKTRKKEFGLMVMHGMTNMQLRKLIFLENGLIGLFATVTGIVIGFALSKLILLAAENVLGLEQMLSFYWPVEAMLLTFVAFVVLFVVISFFTAAVVRGNRLIDLIKGSVQPKPEPKASIWLSVLSVLCIGIGYAVALTVKGVAVSVALIPVSVIVIIGTYFLFTQLSVKLIHYGKSKKSFFWHKTNMLFLSDMAYRMKDNARMFFIAAILSTVAFSAIGALVGFKAMYTKVITAENPFALEYVSKVNNSPEQEKEHLDKIEAALRSQNIPYERYDAVMKKLPEGGSDKKMTVVKASQYNAIAQAAEEPVVQLSEGQAAAIYYSNPMYEPEAAPQELVLQDKVMQVVASHPSVTFPIFSMYYVIPDALFDELEQEGMSQEKFFAFDTEEWRDTKEIGEQLYSELFSGKGTESYDIQSIAYDLYETNQMYGIILFVGLFIGAVFFVAAGSFLYFRLYADLEDDKQKFASIRRLGMTDAEQSSVVSKQLLLLFFVPVGTAIVHGAVALTSMQRMFGYSLVKESAMVLGSFLFIQLVYFLLIRARYIRQLKTGI